MSLSFSSYRLFAVFDKFLKYSLFVLPLFSQNKQRILLLNVTTKNNMACNVFALHSLVPRFTVKTRITEKTAEIPQRPKNNRELKYAIQFKFKCLVMY